MNFESKLSFLEIGCGTGGNLNYLKILNNYEKYILYM